MNPGSSAWLIFSLLTAIAVASQDACVKKFFGRLNPFEMSAYPLIYSLPLFLIALPFVEVPALDMIFFWSFLAGLPVNGVAFVLYMKAIKVSPLSLTLPYLAFTPLFMILTGLVFLGELPNVYGVAGIVFICAGSYVLNLEPKRNSLLSPFKAVFKETGSWIMLIVSFIFSFGAVLGKLAIVHSSAVFFSISFFAVFNSVMILLLVLAGKIRLETFRADPAKGFLAGLLLFAHALFHGWAISMTKAAYMISVKRLSVLFGIIYGGVLFKEKNILVRFFGAMFMLGGAVLIMLKGE